MKTRYALALTGLLLVPAVQAENTPAPAAAPAAQTAPGKAAGTMPQGKGMEGMGMKRDPMMMSDDSLDQPQMQKDLQLTDPQKQQVQAIHKEAKEKHEAIRAETQAKIKQVLTPEQYQKLQDHRAKKMDRREDRLQKREDRIEKRKDHMKDPQSSQ